MTVGALETILLEEDFSMQQKSFCLANCDQFEDVEESKLVYTSLFQSYTELVERMLNDKLGSAIPVSNKTTSQQMNFRCCFVFL